MKQVKHGDKLFTLLFNRTNFLYRPINKVIDAGTDCILPVITNKK